MGVSFTLAFLCLIAVHTASSTLPQDYHCGKSDVQDLGGWSLIQSHFVGHDSAHYKQPWQGAIYNNDTFLCGCSLVITRSNRMRALTAYHCVRNYRAMDLKVRFGQLIKDAKHHDYPVTLIAKPSGFNPETMYQDISVLTLGSYEYPQDAESWMIPICLPTKKVAIGEKAIASGWGHENAFGSPTRELKFRQVPIQDKSICVTALGGLNKWVGLSNICAGVVNVTDPQGCLGDAGGPLVIKRTGFFELVGISSWGAGCAPLNNHAGVYTDVYRFNDWLSTQGIPQRTD